MSGFVQVLTRVRDAGFHVPWLSTDNLPALLTGHLTHFDPAILQSTNEKATLGYVRCGHAIYGQCPEFRHMLRPVSTLWTRIQQTKVSVTKGTYCAVVVVA